MTPDTPAGHGVAAGDLVLAQDLQEVQVAEVPGVGLGEPGSTGSGTCDQARLAVTQDAIAHSRRVVLARAPKVLAKHPMPAVRSLAASLIIVDGRLWGVVNASTRRGPFPSGTADRLADFTELVATAVGNAQSRAELVATAVGNAQSRAELAASRARIVTAADETRRRRIERDPHDGTQQRLVSLGLELRLAQSMVPAGLPELETAIGGVSSPA
jgi:GAF domain-containing protein